MKRRPFKRLTGVGMLAAALSVAATVGAPAAPTQIYPVPNKYIVSSASPLPASFPATVAQRGDVLGYYFQDAGFATVTTTNPAFYASPGYTVVQDFSAQWIEPMEGAMAATAKAKRAQPSDDDFLFDVQWGAKAVRAPQAWAAGYRGAGVRVAVLDTGVDLTHPDLAPNINYELSRDLTETHEGLQWTRPSYFSHGTYVAGIVAAADNGVGVIGIAPQAELLLVKVMFDAGWGYASDIMAGIIYAAQNDADIINLSLGGAFPRREDSVPTQVTVLFDQVATWARRQGTTIIACVGNDALDLDRGDTIFLPACATGVLGVSATAPHGWALDPTGSLDWPASYSNFGRSAVDFAAPGGDVSLPVDYNQICTVGIVSGPCFAFDEVIGPAAYGRWAWAAGTSSAAPHAAGVAALILSEGHITTPAELELELRKRAADLGPLGVDPHYGHGRVSSGY